MIKRYRFALVLSSAVLVLSGLGLLMGRSTADTIYSHDGKEIKGIVVEEYSDRIVLSTVDGELTVLKSDIKELYSDSEEDNLVRLADQAMERRDQARAYSYYERALKVNPESAAAKTGMSYLRGYMLRQKEAKKIEDIKKREEYERYGGAIVTQKSEEEEEAELFRKTSGMTIGLKNNFPVAASVALNSPAYQAGVRKGDTIAAIWGKLTGYMSLDEILRALLKKSALETRCTIERTIEIPVVSDKKPLSGIDDIIGASISMEIDGLTVSAVRNPESGLEKGDLIMAIYGKQTRYMPLKKAVELIKSGESDYVRITFRRNIIIWRMSEL